MEPDNSQMMPGFLPDPNQPQYVPELHQLGPDGNPTHYGMIDPTTGQPMVVPADLHNQIFGQPPPPQIAPGVGNGSGGASGSWEPSAPVPESAPNAPVPAFKPEVPAGPIYGTTTTTDTRQASIPEADSKRLEEDRTKALDANIAMHSAIENEAKAKSAESAAVGAQYEAQLQDMQAKRADFEAKLAEKNAVANAAMEEYSNAKLDTNHYWANSSTGTKVVSGIAMVLGAMGQALQGSKTNPVIDMIDDKIRQDIDAQKTNIEKMGIAANMKKGLVAQFMAEGKDKEEAAQLAYATSLRAVQKQFEAAATGPHAEALKAQSDMGTAEIQSKLDEARAKMNAKEVISRTVTAPVKGGAGAGKPMNAELFDRYRLLNSTIEKVRNAKAILNKTDTGKISSAVQGAKEFAGGAGDKDLVHLDSLLTEIKSNHILMQPRRLPPDQAKEVAAKVVGRSKDNTALLKTRLDAYENQLLKDQAEFKAQGAQEGWIMPDQSAESDSLSGEDIKG